jgi:hypothetical protein
MCGNSLCSEFVDGESHSHDDSKSVDSHDHDGNSISGTYTINVMPILFYSSRSL